MDRSVTALGDEEGTAAERAAEPGGLTRLLVSQSQVLFNDNAVKLALIGLAQAVVATPGEAQQWISAVTAMLIIPFVLFSPLCGWVADHYPKRSVLLGSLVLQLILMVALLAVVYARSLPAAVVVFFFLGVQATLFAPTKQGIIKELVAPNHLSRAVGWVELAAILAILLGGYAGGALFDVLWGAGWDPWESAVIACAVLTALCVPAILVAAPIRGAASASREPFHISLFWRHFQDLGYLCRQRGLRLAAFGVAFFYSLGAFFYLVLVQVARQGEPDLKGAASLAGWLAALMGLGIGVGAGLAGSAARGRVDLSLVPFGGLGLPLILILLGFTPQEGGWLFQGLLVLLGVTGGLFIVPLTAYLQDNAEDERRARVLAATLLLTNLGSIVAVVVQSQMTVAGFSTSAQCFAAAGPCLLVAAIVVATLPESLLRVTMTAAGRILYRVRAEGANQIPASGALLVCNHVSYADALLLQLGCPRPIRFMAWEGFFTVPFLGWGLRAFQTIPVSSTRAKDAIVRASERLRAGDLVCIFPEGQLSRTGKLMGLRKGFELIARRANVPVVPVHLDSLWGSVFSFRGGRYFTKMPPEMPRRVKVSFGEPLNPEMAATDTVRRRLLDLGERAFRERPQFERTLGEAIEASLSKRGSQPLVPGPDGITRAEVLRLGRAFARHLAGLPFGPVIVAVDGPAQYVAVAGAALAGRPFVAAGPDAGRARAGALAAGRTEALAVADGAVGESLKAEGIPLASRRELMDGWWGRWGAQIGPARATDAAVWFPAEDGTRWLMRSHRQILAAVEQVTCLELLSGEDVLWVDAGLEHAPALVLGVLAPMIHGFEVVQAPPTLPERRGVSLLVSGPDRLDRWAEILAEGGGRMFRAIVCPSTGPCGEAVRKFRSEWGVAVLTGLSSPETTGFVSLNLPDPAMGFGATSLQVGARDGSLGRLLPGVSARIIGGGEGAERSLEEVGRVELRGLSVGAEGDDRPWTAVGVSGSFDADGFFVPATEIPSEALV